MRTGEQVYTTGLDCTKANYEPLSPLDFLDRAAFVHPDQEAVIHGDLRYSYRDFAARARRLASALHAKGIGLGDTVAVMAPNIPALLEAHYGVPGCGAVLNALNTRLDAAALRFILQHAAAKLVIVDRVFSVVMQEALQGLSSTPIVIDIDDEPRAQGENLGPKIGEMDYETFLTEGDPNYIWQRPTDEWQAISLNYTSGTTGDPKGVVYHHRGAWLNAQSNLMAYQLKRYSVYLWTLPMFHCNGWCFTWSVTAAVGKHICLRRLESALVFKACAQEGVTFLCGAPIVLTMLLHAPEAAQYKPQQPVRLVTGGAAPPSAVIEGMEALGFDIVHAYGLTETYGPTMTCYEKPDWRHKLGGGERATLIARQGIANPCVTDAIIADPQTLEELPWDGASLGEIMLRGNTNMRGYLKNPKTSAAAFQGGWFHSGDLGVRHLDGYIEVKDRSKDIIISGGENISSLEVEELLYRHPAVMEASVVAQPDQKWGETPCAFVALKPNAQAEAAEIVAWCRDRIAHFKAPKTVIIGTLPKTVTGKVQKFVLREQARIFARK